MNSTFKDTLDNIIGQKAVLKDRDEHAVEIGVVLPLLEYFGWNTRDMSEIYPQHQLPDGGKVDFDLQIGGESRVLMEVKRWTRNLNDDDERQLHDYFRAFRTRFGVLTNGHEWQFYLPPTSKEPRRHFLDVDILSGPSEQVESNLKRFLARERMVAVGNTAKEALSLYSRRKSNEEVIREMTVAWNELATDRSAVANILISLGESRGVEPTEEQANRLLESSQWPLTKKIGKLGKANSFTLRTQKGGYIKKSIPKAKGWTELLVELCSLMHRRHSNSFRQILLSMPNRFSESESTKINHAIDDTVIYATGVGSADAGRRACYEIVEKFGYPRDALTIRDKNDNIL